MMQLPPLFGILQGDFRGSRPPGEFGWSGRWAADCSPKEGAGPTLHRGEAFSGKPSPRIDYRTAIYGIGGEEVKAKNEKCLTCARNARVCSRARATRGARWVRMCARRKNGRELPTLPRAPTVVTRRCVWRGRGGHETSGTALRCSAQKGRRRAYPLVLQCAEAHPDPHNTALFPLSRRIYHRT